MSCKLSAECLGYFPELAILGIAEERGHGVAAVVLGEIPVVVHHVIHGHGRRGVLGPASEDEILDAEEPCGYGGVVGSCAGPQINVVAPGAELPKNFPDVRAGDVALKERPLNVEEDVQGLFWVCPFGSVACPSAGGPEMGRRFCAPS